MGLLLIENPLLIHSIIVPIHKITKALTIPHQMYVPWANIHNNSNDCLRVSDRYLIDFNVSLYAHILGPRSFFIGETLFGINLAISLHLESFKQNQNIHVRSHAIKTCVGSASILTQYIRFIIYNHHRRVIWNI